MSQRGIEIHNGYVVLPPLESSFSVGTRDSPITQSEATLQAVIGAFINTSALGIGWDLHGVWAWINCAVDRDGDIVGVEGRCYVEADITIGGQVYGLHARVYAAAGATLEKNMEGLHLFLQATATAVIQDAIAIHVHSVMADVITGNFFIISLDLTGGADLDAFIYAAISAGSDIDYFLSTAQNTSAWNDTGEPTGTAEGWIKVRLGGSIKYIALYNGLT